MDLLKVKPTDAQALSRAIGVSQRAIESHLPHVAKTVGKSFEITASDCRDCDFKFKDRDRMTKPSKCPKCNGEDICPPQFFIRDEE